MMEGSFERTDDGLAEGTPVAIASVGLLLEEACVGTSDSPSTRSRVAISEGLEVIIFVGGDEGVDDGRVLTDGDGKKEGTELTVGAGGSSG
jgi:hypothetical protein